MALKSRAEVQLLQVLNQNKAKSVSFYLKEQQQKAHESADNEDNEDDYDDNGYDPSSHGKPKRHRGDLAQYRKDARPVREDDEMIAQVRQLQDNFYIVGATASDNNSIHNEEPLTRTQIELNAISRRDKHMAAQQTYTEHVKRVSEDIESAVITCADAIKDALSHIDARVQAASRSLEDDALLLQSANEDILRMWNQEMDAICQQRTQQIASFAQQLDDIELTRTQRVREGLQRLTEVLMDTAHALPPEVERLIESEAYELNAVVISNRKVYADLVARMATADVDVFVSARLTWERGQRRWRELRHADAISQFQSVLNSHLFTDPDERREVLKEIRVHQERVHNDQRQAFLKKLEDAQAELTSEHAREILSSINATQHDEETKNHEFFERLMGVHMAKTSEAQTLREALRLEVHGFGAMSKEGEIEVCQSQLVTLLRDPSLEEFFRMAGGLRGELDAIVKRLKISELIYSCNLEPLTSSLQVLLCTLPLGDVMETHGKGAERKALQATLEKIRKAGKHEILPLLPALQAQMVVLSNLTDMSDEFKAELEEIVFQLDQLIQEYGLSATPAGAGATEGGGSGGTLLDIGAGAATGAASASGTSGKAPPSRSSASRSGVTSTGIAAPVSTETSLASTSSSSSSSPPKTKASEFSQTAAYNFIDLQAIRKVQRRLGTLLYASELSAPIQKHLKFVAEQLALQAKANEVVDRVIAAECDELLDARHQESRLFFEAMGREMEHQSAHLHDQTEKLAKFCLSVAHCMEQSVEKVRYIDLSVMDLLDTLKDDDEDKVATLEAQYMQSCARLRHAPNDAVLQSEFQVSSTLLQQIEVEYRMYHRKTGLATDHHVAAIEQQRRVFLRKLCESFGLSAMSLSDGNPEALDVDTYLSAKYIEDIVKPPPPPEAAEDGGGDRVENPQEGGGPATVGAVATGSTPRAESAAAHPEKHAKAGKLGVTSPRQPAAPATGMKEPFRVSSGLEAEVLCEVPELLTKMLTHVDADESGDSSSSAVAPGDGEPTTDPLVQPANTVAADEREAEAVDEQAAALAARQALQQQQVLEKVAIEFLRLEIPISLMERMLTTLRDAFVSKYDRDGKKTTEVTAETREQRLADSNFLLEERLRMHWPRSGRLGVQIYQPRMGELMSHRQRQERQVRSVLKKADAQELTFASHVKLALEHAEQVRVKQIACQAQLPMQSNLAALQGQEGKSKKLLKAFKVDGGEKVDALQTMIEADVSSLISSLQDFLRACTSQLFPDLTSCDVISGCDYHPDEISSLKEKMVAIEAQLREKIGEREQKVREIVEAQRQVLQLAQTFKTRYQACMQDLSMKDGLGQKYGLPRRTAQERYRSEVTRCNEKSAKMDELLASLNAMVETNESKQLADDRVKAKGNGKSDLTTAILCILLQLRAKMYSRGRYFGLLKNLSQLELVPVTFDPSGGSGGDDMTVDIVIRDRDVVDEQDMTSSSSSSFLDFVQDVSAKCREDTRQIYQLEGKIDELPNGSAPPSLEEYLHGLREKARSYVLHQELKYREQVHFFGELLALAPESALMDLLDRSQASLGSHNERLSSEMEAEFAAFMEQKNRHTVELRPELCSPNNTAQLQALSDREVARSQQTVARLQHFRAQVMSTQVHKSFAFERELVAMFRCLMTILDTCVMTLDDLQPVSGKELPKLKRKSLKRLRKVARIQEFGDAREVKRSDTELQKLTQLGEVPRFPKRAWPAIETFGAHVVWEAQQAQILSHDEQQALPTDDAIKALDGSKFAVSSGESACVALLTHAHRILVGARDAVYTTYMAFCSAQNRQLVDAIQEKLRDELKWVESWQQSLSAMSE